MRVLVASTAGSGHFGPLVPLARACVEAGHEVRVAAPGSFAGEVARVGLEHAPVADVPPQAMGPIMARLPALSFEEANTVVVQEIFGRLDARSTWPGMTEIIEGWDPDLLLREPVELGSLVAATAARLPHATVNAGVSATMRYAAALLVGPLGELDALAGLPDGSCADAMAAAPVLSSVPALLDGPHPPSREAHLYRDDAYGRGTGTLPEPWGDPDHPLVYVTLGSVTGSLGVFNGLYPAILEALADRPVRVLVTTGHGVDVDALVVPPNAHVEQWWPQADVMSHAAAVVGHGGFGTTMGALDAAVPQVVVPVFAFDQRVNAEHVAACGAGLALLHGPASIGSLAGAVDRVLTEPAFRDASRAVADQLATHPAAADVVPVLERLAAG